MEVRHARSALCNDSAIQEKAQSKENSHHVLKQFFKGAFKKKIYEDILAVKQLFIFSDDFIFQLTTISLGNFFGNYIISVFKFLNNYDING